MTLLKNRSRSRNKTQIELWIEGWLTPITGGDSSPIRVIGGKVDYPPTVSVGDITLSGLEGNVFVDAKAKDATVTFPSAADLGFNPINVYKTDDTRNRVTAVSSDSETTLEDGVEVYVDVPLDCMTIIKKSDTELVVI